MNDLARRVLCPECGAVRICCRRPSPYAVCPNGHGKLVRRFTRSEAREVINATLPRAQRVGRNRFQIEGHSGLFEYRNGNGRKAAAPGAKINPGEVIARHVTPRRQLIRVFSQKESRNNE